MEPPATPPFRVSTSDPGLLTSTERMTIRLQDGKRHKESNERKRGTRKRGSGRGRGRGRGRGAEEGAREGMEEDAEEGTEEGAGEGAGEGVDEGVEEDASARARTKGDAKDDARPCLSYTRPVHATRPRPKTPPENPAQDPVRESPDPETLAYRGRAVKSRTGTGMDLMMYSTIASTLYLSCAEIGMTGASCATVPREEREAGWAWEEGKDGARCGHD